MKTYAVHFEGVDGDWVATVPEVAGVEIEASTKEEGLLLAREALMQLLPYEFDVGEE